MIYRPTLMVPASGCSSRLIQRNNVVFLQAARAVMNDFSGLHLKVNTVQHRLTMKKFLTGW